MTSRYLIVGGGMTADAAVRGIRELDAGASIGLIGDEPDPPYSRPPLTKALWKGNRSRACGARPATSAWSSTSKAGDDARPPRQDGSDDRGASFPFDQLLLATGGKPRRLPFGGDDVTYFRTLADYRKLRAEPKRAGLAVIGGGFIGSEIAAAPRCGLPGHAALPGAGSAPHLPEGSRALRADYSRGRGGCSAGRGGHGREPSASGVVVETKGGFGDRGRRRGGHRHRPDTDLAAAAGLTATTESRWTSGPHEPSRRLRGRRLRALLSPALGHRSAWSTRTTP